MCLRVYVPESLGFAKTYDYHDTAAVVVVLAACGARQLANGPADAAAKNVRAPAKARDARARESAIGAETAAYSRGR